MRAGLRIPLAPTTRLRATLGQEVCQALGTVPVAGGDPRGVMVVVHIEQTEGRGTLLTGLRYPDDPEPIWADAPLRLETGAFAVPIIPEADGQDRLIGVLLRLQPLGVGRTCSAWVQAYLQLPPVTEWAV